MNKHSTCIISLFVLIYLSSCASVDTLKKGAGTQFMFRGKKYSVVWDVANTVVAKHFKIISADKNTGVITAEKGADLTSLGDLVGVYITPANINAKNFTVEVVNQKRSSLQKVDNNWENTIVQEMIAELGID